MDERLTGIAAVIRRTKETLGIAQLGLGDFLFGEPTRKIAGLCVLVEFGRAVTNVLQNIRTYDRDRFDRWYEPIQKQMASDPLIKHFYKIRSEILKEGSYSGG